MLIVATRNDIVLLSLVRSNNVHSIGFLSNDNRACVALSRAKRGFYIFGNAELLACESWTWGEVVNIMFKTRVENRQERRIGYYLPLQCAQHKRKVWLEHFDEWDLIHGGCDLKCEGKLSCGHHCAYQCHPYVMLCPCLRTLMKNRFGHDQVNCMMQCSIRLACNHQCMGTLTRAQ
jgi:helicase required for RNAi-mediated heterochromatin assembly 1